MHESPVELYRKKFSSRYELSRELQILDYLGQRKAPVPPVVMSHAEMAYMDMHHGGLNLKEWLNSEKLTCDLITDALSKAIKALISTANFGVWHFDVALRNFVIHNNSNHQTVWLIDFGNAVCPHFSLQKPLWMRPHNEQHTSLQKALTEDWQHFYERHQLNVPHDWRDAFDVSIQLYQDDWTAHLSVESLPQKWCVIAHACGQMLQTAARIQPHHLRTWLNDFTALLNLQEDDVAQRKLSQLSIDLLQASSGSNFFDHEQTPRPRALADEPPLKPSPTTAGSTELLAYDGSSTLRHDPKVPHLGWLGTVVILIAVGWWVIDIAYKVLDYPLSDISAGVLMGLGLTSLGGFFGLFDRARRARWLSGALWTHVLGQFLLIFELWFWGIELGTSWLLLIAPFSALLVLFRHHSTNTT